MREEDIAQVTEVDREAFSTQGPAPDYRRELKNPLAHYIMASDDTIKDTKSETKSASPRGFTALALFFRGRSRSGGEVKPAGQHILGFAGFWLMADEAHIISIATRKEHYRQGIGELLLICLIDLATELLASAVHLEVRASNIAAQDLYTKYGFKGIGIRRGYYSDTGEDGILMALENLASSQVQIRLQGLKQAHSRRWGITDYRIAR